MRLYLDIDGVITASPHSFPGIETFKVPASDPYGDAYVDWHPELFHELVGLFDEVVWATSWICSPEDLTTLEETIGVAYPRVEMTLAQYFRHRSKASCGKRESVAHHYHGEPAPFIWIDDHIGARDKAWARSVGGRTVVPSYEFGGAYSMLDMIKGML